MIYVIAGVLLIAVVKLWIDNAEMKKRLDLHGHRIDGAIKDFTSKFVILEQAMGVQDGHISEIRNKLNEYVDMPVDPEYAKGLENIMNYGLDQAKGKIK